MDVCRLNKMIFVKALVLVLLLATGCGDLKYQDVILSGTAGNPLGGGSTESSTGNETQGSDDKQIPKGNFDLEISKDTQTFNSTSNAIKHVHEYSKAFRTDEVDFFNTKIPFEEPTHDDYHFSAMSDHSEYEDHSGDHHKERAKSYNLPDYVPGEAKFIILVANASLSKKVNISINGITMSAENYSYIQSTNLLGDVFSLEGHSDTIKLRSLKISIDTNEINNHGLVHSTENCVLENVPGTHGEYRNGAFLVQIVDAEKLTLNEAGTAAAGLYYEVAIYAHDNNKCN